MTAVALISYPSVTDLVPGGTFSFVNSAVRQVATFVLGHEVLEMVTDHQYHLGSQFG